MNDQATKLAAIPVQWKQPPKEMIGKLPKGGAQLDFVGHANVTLILTDIDPLWTLEPVCDERGIPIVEFQGSDAYMWGRLTIHGHSRMGVGVCTAKAFDLHKQLMSDLLKNCAMRFGVATSLWSKEEFVAPPPPPEPLFTVAQRAQIRELVDLFDPNYRQMKETFKDWWSDQGFPSLKSGQLTERQAAVIIDHLENLDIRPGFGTSTGSAPVDTDEGGEATPLTVDEQLDTGEAGGSTHPAGPPTAAARAALERTKR